MTLKNRIRYWRKRLKMTQVEFAGFTGFTQSNISHWERSRTLSPENAMVLMKKLRVVYPEIHMEDLYEDNEDKR